MNEIATQYMMFGEKPERAYGHTDLINQIAKTTPSASMTKEDWRREVIGKCITTGPRFESMVDSLENTMRRGFDRERMIKAFASDFIDYVFDKDVASFETLTRGLRLWTEKHKPVFKDEFDEPRPSRTLR